MIQKLKCTMTLLTVFGIGWATNTILAQDQTVDAGTSAISLVEVPSRRVAYVEHIGPYWALGKVMAQTQAHIAKEHHGSSLFIRYITNPGKTQPQKLKVEIGFVLAKDAKTHTPFLIREEPATTSITWSINEPTISPRAAYAQLQQWAKMHDLTPVGPMIELHVTTDSLGSKARVTTLEFQMPLEPSDPTAIATTSEAESKSETIVTANPRSVSGTQAGKTELNQGSVDGVSVTNEANKSSKANRSIEIAPNSGRSRPKIPDTDSGSIVSVPDEAESTPATPTNSTSIPATTTTTTKTKTSVPTPTLAPASTPTPAPAPAPAPAPTPTSNTAQAVGGNEALETARAKARGSGEHLEHGEHEEHIEERIEKQVGEQIGESSEALSAPPIIDVEVANESIESLFVSGEYDQLAMQLMSDQPAKSNATIVWLGQLSFRISAAAKGIQDQYANDAQPLLRLGHALRKRHALLADKRNLDTLKRATVQVEAGSEASRAKLAKIMRRMDRMLAGIAFKQISPDDANREIVNLLTQVNELFSVTAQ